MEFTRVVNQLSVYLTLMFHIRTVISLPIKTAPFTSLIDNQTVDLQYISENNKAFLLKTSDPTMQPYTVDILISHSNDESNLRGDTAPTLLEDGDNIPPDSFGVMSLQDPAPQVPNELWQSFPLHQRCNDLS